MSQEIPGITPQLHEVAYKPAELSASIRALETGRDTKNDLEDAFAQFQEFKAALYASRITLVALMKMGAITPNLDLERFKKEVDRIRMKLGLPIEPSVLNRDEPIYVITPEEE